MRVFSSVKFKIFALITIFFAVTLSLNLFYEITDSNKQFKHYLENLNQSSAKLLVQNTSSDLYNLDYTKTKLTVDSFDNSYFENIYILNSDGYIFAQRSKDKIVFEKYKGFDALKNLENKNSFLYFSSIKLANKTVGYLVIENNAQILQEIIDAKENKIFQAFFIILVIVMILSYIISVIITQPIRNIINSLKDLDKSKELKINYNKQDEFGYLAKKIEQNHNQIKDLNENLEKKIEEEVKKNLYKEKQLLEAQKMASMGEMIGNIAHQWRQPLSVISTASTGIIMEKEFGVFDETKLVATCHMMNENAQYLSKTIDDFKNFIKGDREKSLFNLKDDIASFLSLIDSSIKNHNIIIIQNIEKDIQIDGYANELTQCLINIFNNAKDALKENIHTPQKRLFFITAFVEKDTVVIKLQDNGGGIPEDMHSKIFEPYFTTKHKSLGTGLGLHMTYNLITDGMKGTIKTSTVNYKYDDKDYIGALFIITLPLK